MATWPATLPRPTVSGYQLAPVDQTVRTDMEAGLARQRRRTAARNDQISVLWLFDDAEMAAFRAWFDDAAQAAGGAAWFTSLPLATGDGGVVTSQEARFVGTYTADALPGLLWQVNARLEIR